MHVDYGEENTYLAGPELGFNFFGGQSLGREYSFFLVIGLLLRAFSFVGLDATKSKHSLIS